MRGGISARTRTFQKTLQISGAADLQINTHSGDISIRPGPAGTISITGRIHVGDAWFMGLGSKRTDEVTDIENNPPIRRAVTACASTT